MENAARFFDNKGISLIELVVSLGILAMVLVPTISLFSAAIYNNKITQDSINAKYLAERYMEIARSTPVGTALESALGTGFVYTPGNPAIYENTSTGALISCRVIRTMSLGENLLSFGNTPIDINGVNRDLLITAEANAGNIVLKAKDQDGNSVNIFNDGISVLYADEGYYTKPAANDPQEIKLLLRFNDPYTITVLNDTSCKLIFYCTNQDSSGDFLDDRKKIPDFSIGKGQVAYYDFTVPPVSERLPEESDEFFTDDAQTFPLSYEISVRVWNDTGPPYEITSMKAVR